MSEALQPLTMVAAMSTNRVIGRQGELPWHIPGDLKFFKQTTMGHAIIMGRKTFDSVGKALPGRHNIVVTRQRSLQLPGCDVVHSLDEAIALARAEGDENPHIVGGESLYRAALPKATHLILTEVHQHISDGDTFFPEVDQTKWRECRREEHVGYAFTYLERV